MSTLRDLTGQRFGKLVVLERIESAPGTTRKRTRWLCKCDCGNFKEATSDSLIWGRTRSCGCIRGLKSMTHGLSSHRLYGIWCGIRDRCARAKNKSYLNYGNRGIKVCSEWLNNFQSFYDWAVVNGYKDNLTIDRIDVNCGYSPDNCRWATIKEQENNRTNNHNITYKGVTKTISEWAEIFGLDYDVLKQRIIKYHWSVEDAFTMPVRKTGTFRNLIYKGEKITVSELSRRTGIKRTTLTRRLFKTNGNIEEALNYKRSK